MQLELHQLDLRYDDLRIRGRARQARLAASMSQHGQQVPVLVVAGDEGRYVLIDGYARVAAVTELGRDVVEAVELPVSEDEALVMCHRLETQRPRSALEDGWLLATLVDRHGLKQKELAARLRRSSSWVSRRLSLVRVLPEAVQEAVREGRVPAQAAMKYLVLLSRDNRSAAEHLVEHLGSEPVTERELATLYTAWRRGDAEQRQRIVDHPRLYLKADEELSQPAPPEPDDGEVQALVSAFEGMARLGWRARSLVRHGALQQAEGCLLTDVRRGFLEARLAFDTLTTLMEGTGHDRLRDPDGDPAPAQAGAQHPGHRSDAGRVSPRRHRGRQQRAGAGPAP